MSIGNSSCAAATASSTRREVIECLGLLSFTILNYRCLLPADPFYHHNEVLSCRVGRLIVLDLINQTVSVLLSGGVRSQLLMFLRPGNPGNSNLFSTCICHPVWCRYLRLVAAAKRNLRVEPLPDRFSQLSATYPKRELPPGILLCAEILHSVLCVVNSTSIKIPGRIILLIH